MGWRYDDESKRVIATFVDMPEPEDADPNFQPTMTLEVELLPRIVDQTPVEQPEQAQIEQLNSAVDQLILDNLMGELM